MIALFIGRYGKHLVDKTIAENLEEVNWLFCN